MYTIGTNPATLFLPLLTNPNLPVRQQAVLIYMGIFGPRSLTYLRRLLDNPDTEVRMRATHALRAVAELSHEPVWEQPFPAISIECLGRVRLYVGSDEVRIAEHVRQLNSAAGWQKVEATLAYLIHCGRRGATVAAIGAAVWGSATSTANVTRTLEALRRVIINVCGEELAARLIRQADDHWSLAADEYFSDVAVFEEALGRAYDAENARGRAAAADLYAQAFQLYGGPYMAGLLLDAPWARTRRAHLRDGYLIAAECLMEHNFGRERYRDCIEIGTAVFDADETADEVVAWLLRAHHQLGEWGQVEYLFRRYLNANHTDAHHAQEENDVVAETYAELRALRNAA
jgi:DNA-binding SARP family transcriptional activator